MITNGNDDQQEEATITKGKMIMKGNDDHENDDQGQKP
jgi:hypothetical protein